MGLHQRYATLLEGQPEFPFIAGRKELEDEIRKEMTDLFIEMMKAVFNQKGAQLSIDILEDPRSQNFVERHASVLDSSFQTVKMSDTMRRRLTRSNYIFSGMKTFHELNEAFPSLLDENGNRKSFERFLNDVRKIDKTYNSNYLRAEYNFVQTSVQMAAKWEEFMEDGDRYNLQYRTANDGKVRPEHAAMHGITLPPSDPFWEEFYPPNGWNCRCNVVQVRKSKYPATDHEEAMALGELATGKDSKGIFRFNPGKEEKCVPDYNPYTISRCRDCDIAKGKLKLARSFIDDNQLCQVCRFLHNMTGEELGRRLNKQERKEIQEATLAWVNKHLPKTTMSDGTQGARLTMKTADGYELHIGKKFFTETYSKCKNSRRVAETMEMATHIGEWIAEATHQRTEVGRHHDFNFEVFTAPFKGKTIEFKAKCTEGLIVYLMRIL